MRVVVVGATGNVGTSVIRSLVTDGAVESVVGLARRVPDTTLARVEWRAADVCSSDLAQHFRGADAVVHLAWLIQPSRDMRALRAVNVDGSRRVFSAVASAGVPTLVYASSVGAYSPGPKDRLVDESWPAHGVPTSFYSVHKAEVEDLLEVFEREHPDVRVVRLRPALIFKRGAAAEIRRYFAGPLLPGVLLRTELIPLVPDVPGLRFQAVHSLDVGDAYRLAVTRDVRGAFNIAADPVLDPRELARLLHARRLPVPAGALRAAADLSWRLHLQPTPPGWLDMALNVPLMDTRRARQELGWEPRHTASEALLELLEGMRESAGESTPPLEPRAGGPLRIGELIGGPGRGGF